MSYKRFPVLTIWILMFAPSCVNCFTFADKYSLSQGSHHKESNIKKCHIKEKTRNRKETSGIITISLDNSANGTRYIDICGEFVGVLGVIFFFNCFNRQ